LLLMAAIACCTLVTVAWLPPAPAPAPAEKGSGDAG
jgi:hypothetical protein